MNCGWTYWNSHSFQVSHTITPLNNYGNTSFSLFQQYQNHVVSHVQEFMRFIRESNTMHEDIRIRLFPLSLHLEVNLYVRNWYEGLPCKIFSYLKQFIDAFSTDWDYSIEERERNSMIDRIWEEAMGKIYTQDDVREGNIDDIPFKFEDTDNLNTT